MAAAAHLQALEKKGLLKVAKPTKEKNWTKRDKPEDEKRDTIFLKLQNIPVDILDEFEASITTWVKNQNGIGNYMQVCGPAVVQRFTLDQVRVKMTKEEIKEKKRQYNYAHNQKAEVKERRKQKLANLTEEEKKKREEKSKNPLFQKRKRETAQDLRRTSKRIRREYPDIWNRIRTEVKSERSKEDVVLMNQKDQEGEEPATKKRRKEDKLHLLEKERSEVQRRMNELMDAANEAMSDSSESSDDMDTDSE